MKDTQLTIHDGETVMEMLGISDIESSMLASSLDEATSNSTNFIDDVKIAYDICDNMNQFVLLCLAIGEMIQRRKSRINEEIN